MSAWVDNEDGSLDYDNLSDLGYLHDDPGNYDIRLSQTCSMRQLNQTDSNYSFYRIVVYRVGNKTKNDEEVRVTNIVFYETPTQDADDWLYEVGDDPNA